MKRTSILITTLIVLSALGYLLYDKYYPAKVTNLLSLVPGNASLVYENKRPFETWDKLLKSDLWSTLGQIPAFNSLQRSLEELDSAGGQTGLVENSTSAGVLLSVHKISNTKLDAILYLDLGQPVSQEAFGKILGDLEKEGELKMVNRTYQGFQITELLKKEETKGFSYIVYNNLFVGSFTSFLVEDVVRLINAKYQGGFFDINAPLNSMPKLAKDDGNVYIDFNQFSSLVNVFSDSNLDIASSFAHSMFYDVTLENDLSLFSGFTQTQGQDLLHTFLAQLPQKNNFQYYVSNKASHFYQLGYADGETWHSWLMEYWKQSHPAFLESRTKFSKDHNYDFDQMFAWLGTGIGLVNIPSSTKDPHRLIIIDTKDITEALNQLNRFSESLARLQNDSVYVEGFGGLTIRELKVKDFPMQSFGPLFTGFGETFYTSIDEYILLSGSIQTIKELVSDIENENTLGRSVSYNKFSANTLEESNFKLVVNTSGLWENLLVGISPAWRPFFQESAKKLKSLRYLSFDFSALDDSFYSSFAVQYNPPSFSLEKKLFETKGVIALDFPIITKPNVVKSHVDNSREVLLQDSQDYVMLLSSSGEKLWQKQLEGAMTSEVDQVDYYKNGKLQYFFATEKSIHIIDRLGNYVDGFPQPVEFKIKYASVIDYDKSKRYRFMLADERGNLYLYNKEGVNLEGWTPKALPGRLAFEPFHLRVRAKDVIIAVQNDGTIHVMNRRGENMPGFPLEVAGRFEGKAYVELGADLGKTTITILSLEGRLIQFNLAGNVVSTEQLYRPTQESVFRLINDALGKTYLIARQDLSRLVLMDRDKTEMLSKDYLSTEKLEVQYYNFSSANQVYAVTDRVQGFTYVYDTDGELISARPIDSEQEIGLMYYDAQSNYEIFAVSGNTFKKLSF